MELPREFVERMEKLLGQEAEALLEQYQQEDRLQGLPANSLKVSAGELERALPFSLRPVPWCPEGFYYGPEGPARPAPLARSRALLHAGAPAPWLWGC